MTIYSSKKKNGYSTEEAYFAKIDRELIKNIRKSAEIEKSEEDDNVIEAADRFQNKDQNDQKEAA